SDGHPKARGSDLHHRQRRSRPRSRGSTRVLHRRRHGHPPHGSLLADPGPAPLDPGPRGLAPRPLPPCLRGRLRPAAGCHRERGRARAAPRPRSGPRRRARGGRAAGREHPMTLRALLLVATALFSIGIYGLLTRRQAVALLLSIEVMANAANLVFVAFARYGG